MGWSPVLHSGYSDGFDSRTLHQILMKGGSMFRNWKWWLLGIILILFVPVIPYEKEISHGVVEVSNKAIGLYLYERYEKNQKKINERIMNEAKTNAPVAQ